MKVIRIVGFILATTLATLPSTASHAQHPICAPPSPSQTYLAICKPGLSSIQRSAQLLTRFSVDHLFNPPQEPFSFALTEMAAPFIGLQLVENDDLYDSASDLAEIEFMRLDNSTGTLTANFEEPSRTLSTEHKEDDWNSQLSLNLPLRLEGGYWRAPDVLQMAFWRDHRPSIRFALDNQTIIESEVACLSLSAGSLKIDLVEADQPGIIVSLGSCE